MNDLLIKFEGDFSDRQFEQFLVNEINGRTNKNSLSILFSENNRAVRSIIEKLNSLKIQILDLKLIESDLENIFLKLTSKN